MADVVEPGEPSQHDPERDRPEQITDHRRKNDPGHDLTSALPFAFRWRNPAPSSRRRPGPTAGRASTLSDPNSLSAQDPLHRRGGTVDPGLREDGGYGAAPVRPK